MDKRKFNEREKEKFRKYAERKAPNSNLPKDLLLSFIIGGTICCIGQGIGDILKTIGVSQDNVKILLPCSLIVISNILTVLGLYGKIAKFAGAGTLVPITGFANAVCSVSVDSKAEGYILGVGAKMFTIAGPVILYGTAASVIYGVIYYFLTAF